MNATVKVAGFGRATEQGIPSCPLTNEPKDLSQGLRKTHGREV